MQAGILEDIVSHTVILHFAARSNDEAIERELITIVTAWSDWSAVVDLPIRSYKSRSAW